LLIGHGTTGRDAFFRLISYADRETNYCTI
jgi:hypothetical protein